MNLAVLKAEARATAERRQARLQKAIDENRDLTAEEETAEAEDKAKADRLQKQITRAEELMASASAIGLTANEERRSNDTPGDDATGRATGRRTPAAARPALDNGGFRDMAEFAQAVRCANPAAGQGFRVDDRLAAPTNVHMEGGDEMGSYLVPPEFRQQITDLVFGDGNDPIMDLISPEATGSNRVVGLGDETTPWGSTGVKAFWRAEAEQMRPTRAQLTPRETKLNEVYAFVLATEELLQDAPRVSGLLTNHASAAIRWTVADAFMWGDGVDKPLGWMASPAAITVAKDANQAAGTISRFNIAKMFARMIQPSGASWLANSEILPQLMEIASQAGQPLWFPNYQDAPGGTLLGRPIIFNEHSRTLGARGDIQFVNPNGYEAFRRQNAATFAESIHLYFDYALTAYRWMFRIGGQPVLSKPVPMANSATTKSHFVTLAERA
ncbi:phage major capsid protein [Sphingomonas beigongshangi]|uniref:phage major capsid protein n=1 Tax=Sphingomonas beigongshangi TaxID=2782540 RepID=UPI001AEDCF4E|nr:phage major capsid protein [Sphingomonas beigongshangi]